MENAVKSLEIVFGVMIFVLALSITISMFGQARQTFQAIVEMREADESYVTDSEGNYINYININGETRTVSIETVIPMMYRAYKENFRIEFYNSALEPLELYKDFNGNSINYIDLENENYANVEAANKHLDNILEENLYKNLQGKIFTEKLGEYYLEDKNGYTEDVADINKTKKRVIIYIVKQ